MDETQASGMKELERLYYDAAHPAGYGGARNLKNSAREVNVNSIEEWLRSQDVYTLHKPVHRKFPRLHYNISNIDELWETDLVELGSMKDDNDGYRYLLVVIDVLSKFVWVIPLLSKTTSAVANGFNQILASTERRPTTLQSDKGKEFVGAAFQKLLKENDIRFRTTRNPDIKAAVVERFNRTLKDRMWRYFTHKNTHRYIDVLQSLVSSYNNTVHSSIRMAPSAVTLYNAAEARANIQRRHPRRERSKLLFKIDDLVRISKTKGTFAKGYEANWSEELFKIRRVLPGIPNVYELEDLAGEQIDGLFYEPELQRVKKDVDNDTFEIDKIIRSRGHGASKQVLVSWKGYPAKFNSWISADSVQDIAPS